VPLSDKTARKEFGLTQNEIVQAIRAGKLQYRHNSIHGNPFLRLLRRGVEALVKQKHGNDYLKNQLAKTELAHIIRELSRLKTQVAAFERRKSHLMGAVETRRPLAVAGRGSALEGARGAAPRPPRADVKEPRHQRPLEQRQAPGRA
jgi:hypothetical protein